MGPWKMQALSDASFAMQALSDVMQALSDIWKVSV